MVPELPDDAGALKTIVQWLLTAIGGLVTALVALYKALVASRERNAAILERAEQQAQERAKRERESREAINARLLDVLESRRVDQDPPGSD